MHAIFQTNIVGISAFLNLQDLLSLSQTCKSLSSILNYDLLWSQILSSLNLVIPFIIEGKPQNMLSQTYFKQIYEKFKEIKGYLLEICKKLGYEHYFKLKSSQISFLSPNRSKINSIKQTIENSYGSIPVAYFLLYHIMNGQNSLDCLTINYNVANPKALFGGFSYYYDYYEFFFLPLETFLCGFLRNLKFHPFAKEHHNFYLFNDFGNYLEMGPETIFTLLAKKNTPNGLVYIIYVLHENLVGFLKEIKNLNFDSNEEKQYLDHFDTLNNPGSDVTTNGIRIRARAIFNPWDQRDPEKNFFPYQIRISNAGVQKAFRLVSRKWIIKYDDVVEEVEGEGVIGKYPLITPGCEDFVYESVSMITGYEGSMEGSFLFKAEDGSKEMIEAVVGRFLFQIEAGRKILKVNLEKKEIVRMI